MPPQSTPFTEARTVENPILKWLRMPELGWRYEDQQAVARKYRTDSNGISDERKVRRLKRRRPKPSLTPRRHPQDPLLQA